MQTKEYTTIDRGSLGWPPGSWDGEPDKVQWPDAATGLPCLAVRNPRMGHWCGYVGVPPEHPLHGKGRSGVDFDVHGGITYADACQPEENEAKGICHTPDPGEPDHVWWFGFDCAHSGDWSPSSARMERDRGYPFCRFTDETYKTLDYVRSECASLAAQLKEARP